MKTSILKEISRANQEKSFKMSNKQKKIAYLCKQFNLAVANYILINGQDKDVFVSWQ